MDPDNTGLFLYLIASFIIIECAGTMQRTTKDRWAYLGIGLLILQALLTLYFLSSTPYFAAGASVLAGTILAHHIVIHWRDDTEEEHDMWSWWVFQLHDIANHETWIVASLVASWISYFNI